MAEETKKLEREYTIPLRSAWLKVPSHERSRKAVKTIKKFLAKHMHVTDRDPDKVKIDILFNNQVWFRGKANPPTKVKVKAIKEGEIVRVTFAEEPAHLKFHKARHARIHVKADSKPEEKKEVKTEEEKKNETEKEKSVESQNIKQVEQDAKALKHTTKSQKAQHPQRMALKK